MSAIGGGIDVNSIVASLISIDRQNRIIPIQQNELGVSTKLSLYGQIKSAFSDFESKSRALLAAFTKYQTEYANTDKKTITNNGDGTVTIHTPGNGEAQYINTKTTSNSNPSAIQLNNTPAYGTYDISVVNRNQSQETRIATGNTNSSAVFGGGTLNISFANGRQESITFAQDDGSGNVPNATAQNVVDGINAANKGLTASFDNTTGEIVIKSTDVGAGNAFTLSTSGEINQAARGFTPSFGPNDGNNTDKVGFSRLANGTITQVAKDTTVTVNDGTGAQTFSSYSENFSALGVDFTVLDFGSTQVKTYDKQDPNPNYVAPSDQTRNVEAGDPAAGQTVVLTSPSQSSLNSSIDAFIKSYNDLIQQLKQGQAKGTTLDRDLTPVRLEEKMRDIFNQVVGGTETKLDLGFSISKDGVLSVDKDKLSKKLTNDPDAFKRIMADNVAKQFADYAKGVNEDGGALKAKTDQLNRTLESLKSREDRENTRLAKQEALYRQQYIALDKILSDMQASQGSLAQGLASLNAQLGR